MARLPNRQAFSQPQQQGSGAVDTEIGDSGRDRSVGSTVLLERILARVDDIHRYCENLVQMQAQQAEQIVQLEAAIRQHTGGGGGGGASQAQGLQFLRTPAPTGAMLSSGIALPQAPQRPRPQSLSSAIRWSARAGDAMAADLPPGLPFPQQDASPSSRVPRPGHLHLLNRTQGIRDQPFDAGRGAADAEGAVAFHPTQSDAYAATSPHRQQQRSYHYGGSMQQQQQQQLHHAQYPGQSAQRQPIYLHQSRIAPYSTRTSPTRPVMAVQSPTLTAVAPVSAPAGPDALQRGPQHSSSIPSGGGAQEAAYQPQNLSAVPPALRLSQHVQHYSAHHAMVEGGARSAGLSFVLPTTDERLAHVQSPYAAAGLALQQQRQRAAAAPHGSSASPFGYPIQGGGAAGPPTGMAEQPLEASGGAGATGLAVPPHARAKRLRVAEHVDEFPAGAGAADSRRSRASSYVHSHHSHQPPPPQQQHYHLQTPLAPHQQPHSGHAMLPPMRAGIMGPVPGPAADPGRDKGKAPEEQAVGSMAARRQQQQQQQRAFGQIAGPAATRGGNPEAQPTQAWLAGQRQYKNALLHLLTLESFYPSDVAMLNVFRAQGDFSSEQIEANGAAMLSWARSWLRYNRNAVIRSTLDSKAKATLVQLAETLQHDLHAETDFTTTLNLRRCALLRLIYYQWQAANKLGTKSQSLYRDYETRLREIEALATPQEQETEWEAILREEQTRRLALIREGRVSGGSAVLLKPEPAQQQQQQRQQSEARSPMNQPGWTVSEQTTPTPQQAVLPRRQSMDWQPRLVAGSPSLGQAHVHQHLFLHHHQQYHRETSRQRDLPALSFGNPMQAQADATQVPHAVPESARGPQLLAEEGDVLDVGRDEDSDMSVKLSPEPRD